LASPFGKANKVGVTTRVVDVRPTDRGRGGVVRQPRELRGERGAGDAAERGGGE
jgi:hypothetical protein